MHKRLITGVLIAFIFSNCSLFVPSSGKLYKRALKKHPQYDAVIVPGVPFYPPDWDKPMLMRVVWAVHLYKRGITKNIIMSGSAVYTPYVEAKIMKQYAMVLGVPEDHIFVEDKAEHSTENVWYGFKLAKKLGFEKVALCSDPFQTRLLHRFGKKRTKGLEFLPTLFDTLKTLSHATPVIEYKHLKLDTATFIPLPQRESKWKRLKGTWGKSIDYKDKN
jgi:uncharacterized SAM-binding protein YcdF (DUF218 family)